MSLDWDLSEIENWRDLCMTVGQDGEKRLNPVTDALIWYSLRCDFGRITKQNAEDVFRRIAIDTMVYGPLLRGSDGMDLSLGLQDVIDHIGLRTNVGQKTFAAYLARMKKVLDQRSLDALRKSRESGRSLTAELRAKTEEQETAG